MNKKKIGEKTDSLLEAEMIKEAKMIEESLLGNAANDFEISDEELDEAYQQFLKKMKAEGKLDEDKINEANSAKAMNNDTKTAEIVKFPGFRNEASKEENLKDAQVQLRKLILLQDFLISYVSLKKKKINPGTNMERQQGLQFLLQSVFLPEVWQARLIQRNLSALFSIL